MVKFYLQFLGAWWREGGTARLLSPIWKTIFKLLPVFRDATTFHTGNGKTLLFWSDEWCGPRSLSEDFPGLHRVANNLSCSMADSWSDHSWNLQFRRGLNDEKSKQDYNPYEHKANLAWKLSAPSKIKFFVWSAIREQILTLDNLHRRGFTAPDLSCPLFGECEETVQHVLLHCGFSWQVWMKIFQKIGLHLGLH
ncbi:uncharacterized protein [Aristolochia californica]|uniref:uncharacterized protein n=1 Tax=Aristolochia californica TaxID=171875 RepID=UPI0035DD35B5